MRMILAALLGFSMWAFASETETPVGQVSLCSDGFHLVHLASENSEVTLMGFDMLGIPSGAKFNCESPANPAVPWFDNARHTCKSDKEPSTGLVLEPVTFGAVQSVVLINSFGVPIFNGVCTTKQK